MTSLLTEPTQVWLEITPDMQVSAQQQCQPVTHKGGAWRIYINQLCLKTVLAWVREEYEPNAIPMHRVEENPVLWEMVTGSGIELASKRFIFIPAEGTAQDELRVPWEWVDLPSWRGDYYFAVNVDLENEWVEVWGYATHSQLTQGVRDNFDRQYSLDASALTRQLYVLQAQHQLQLKEATQAELEPIAQPEEQQANNLIQRLAKNSEIFPRLSILFEQWGELLEHRSWREKLCQRRWTTWLDQSRTAVNLRAMMVDRIQQLAETGWRTLEEVFEPQEVLRLKQSLRGVSSQPILRSKTLDFSPQAPEQKLRLLMQLESKDEAQISVLVHLHRAKNKKYLPTNVSLKLLSQEGEELRSIQAPQGSNYISLTSEPFQCEDGDRFLIEVELDGHKITEIFTAESL